MSLDSEKMKALVSFKKKLEKKLEELEAEKTEVLTTLETVNQILLEKGFKRGDIKEVPQHPKEPPTVVTTRGKGAMPFSQEQENVIPLKTLNEEPLAIIYVETDSLHVLPDESKSFSVNTPPFNHFLVERILARMQEKDSELVRMGQLTVDKMFSYNIVREGDLIREIIIKNVDEERLRELKSSLRWTFEKMYEKMKI
ncbi:TPA: hypothetical protein HA273_00500 [Candidatus Bathyarchaeota archaeon]|nr:hypothetical protein [Candidatus Bathyarchaeota archaeon]